MVHSTVGRSERVPQAISGICPVEAKLSHSRLVSPGMTASMLPTVETKLLFRFGSMPVAVPSITAKPAPVGPEWPHTEPGITAAGNDGQILVPAPIGKADPLQVQPPVVVTRGSGCTMQFCSSTEPDR